MAAERGCCGWLFSWKKDGGLSSLAGKEGQMMFFTDLAHLVPSDYDGGDADGDVADGHDDPDADAAQIRKLLQKPQHRHPEDEDPAEVDEQGHPGLAKAVEQGHDGGVDAQRDGAQGLHPVDGGDHLAELPVRAGKEGADLV